MTTAGGTGMAGCAEAASGAGEAQVVGAVAAPVVALAAAGSGSARPGREVGSSCGGGQGREGQVSEAGGEEGDTVCLDRRELQDLLRRVRGLERLIGRVLGGVANERGALG